VRTEKTTTKEENKPQHLCKKEWRYHRQEPTGDRKPEAGWRVRHSDVSSMEVPQHHKIRAQDLIVENNPKKEKNQFTEIRNIIHRKKKK
jgi:hypothetical protein